MPVQPGPIRLVLCSLLFLLLVVVPALPALAGDGVLEINQTCAVETGCFAGDVPGFPVTIDGTSGHSYRLTSDLVVPNENTDGIVADSDDVGIDLAGFEIRGVVVCSGSPLVCTPGPGTGVGVRVPSVSLSGLSVRNGSIRGMGAYGVIAGIQGEVTHLRVRSNRVDGIFAGSGSTVLHNTAYANGLRGISTVNGTTVFGNTTYLNGTGGISTGTGSAISGNTAFENGGDGIFSGVGSTITGNTVRSNKGFGLNLGVQCGYRENVITNNTAGTVSGTGLVNLGNNACNGSATCP
ncbi:MAG: right-handed parallel beta-helix repeat-containing protein [Deltaproteobacteria bacterium]|nr:right-handed parallel beta-helix repeat-containing protein [Deltaproteobacteria bacterium]